MDGELFCPPTYLIRNIVFDWLIFNDNFRVFLLCVVSASSGFIGGCAYFFYLWYIGRFEVIFKKVNERSLLSISSKTIDKIKEVNSRRDKGDYNRTAPTQMSEAIRSRSLRD